MGVLKSIGKGAFGVAKGAAVGTARIGGDIAGAIGKGTTAYGSKILGNALSSPLKTAAAIGGAAAIGYGLADLDGRSDGGKVAGKAALGVAAASAIPGVSTVAAGAAIAGVGAVGSVGGLAMGLGSKMIKAPSQTVNFSNLNEVGFTKLGKGLVLGSGLYEGASRAIGKFESIRMGTNDGMMRTHTPIIPQGQNNSPSYANNGGATGDLVFSMYNNR